jgi:ribosomal protein L37AE/L43A
MGTCIKYTAISQPNQRRTLMAIRGTKRPQNQCRSCGYTWYPRGKRLSAKCPKCGSEKTKVVGFGLLAILFVLALFVVGSNGRQEQNSSSVEMTEKALPPDQVEVQHNRAISPKMAVEVTPFPTTASGTVPDTSLKIGPPRLASEPEQPTAEGTATAPTVDGLRDPFTIGG